MFAEVRNQIRHRAMYITQAKLVDTCRYLVNSNLKANMKLWNDFNEKPHSVAPLFKTVLPASCQVIDATVPVDSLGFIMNELKKVGCLLDKINVSVSVLAMNPDLVQTVKMSVCILGEAARLERRIKGLDEFIRPGNIIAHEFGEECEHYSTDEISLFDIRKYVDLAKSVYEKNVPKPGAALTVLRANASVFNMSKPPMPQKNPDNKEQGT
jgi:hypothetical protein